MATGSQSKNAADIALAILQEQYRALREQVTELRLEAKEARSLAIDLARELKQMSEIKYTSFISKEEFKPVLIITYGLVALVMSVVFSAILVTTLGVKILPK